MNHIKNSGKLVMMVGAIILALVVLLMPLMVGCDDKPAIGGEQLRKGFVDISEGPIYYETQGSGEPLLLLHQAPFTSAEYSDMIPILAESYTVIAMDYVGHGNSANPPREYEIEDYARSVISFLDALGIKKTSIVGHHTGSSIAVEIAATYPDRVDKLIVSGVPSWDAEGWEAYFQSMASAVRAPADDGLFLTDWWGAIKMFAPELETEQALKAMAILVNALTKPYDAHYAVARHPINERLPMIESPTLLVSGSMDVFIGDLEVTKNRIPRCKTMVIEDATAFICFEKPNEFAEAILDFMENPGI